MSNGPREEATASATGPAPREQASATEPAPGNEPGTSTDDSGKLAIMYFYTSVHTHIHTYLTIDIIHNIHVIYVYNTL